MAPGRDVAPLNQLPTEAEGVEEALEQPVMEAGEPADTLQPVPETADEAAGAAAPGEEGETAAAEPVDDSRPRATLRALDKVTAAITEVEVPVGETVAFGSLMITLRTCRSEPPEEPPETFAFLEIDDDSLPEGEERMFSGWMMASSPALNPLEHAIYDVWVISCTIVAPGVPSGRE